MTNVWRCVLALHICYISPSIHLSVKLYTAAQIRDWDAFTIAHEPIASIDLMERAAAKCVAWLLQHYGPAQRIAVFCGKGNNGGDGLAIARMLHQRGLPVEVFILEFGAIGSPDFQANLQRMHQFEIPFHFVQEKLPLPLLHPDAVIIDALFGTGLNRPLEGLAATVVAHINKAANEVVSIDVPSGMMLDASVENAPVISAHYSLSFQATKAAFLLPENETQTGKVVVLDIGLHAGYEADAPFELLEIATIKKIMRPRSRFAHKGSFGHGLIIGGSYGKMGAVVLSTRALLRSGAGLATAYVPKCGYNILQTTAPEAMTMTDEGPEYLTQLTVDSNRFSAVGIGPGMGTDEATLQAFANLLPQFTIPLVVDADGLNLLARRPELLQQLPPQTILTPHPKEFSRMFGESNNDFDRVKLALDKAAEHNMVIILKGHHSLIASPGGKGYFNSTGNAGMATGGSGDVLTGLLTGLLAQGYNALDAALIGVYLHGLAGDLAAARLSQEAMIAGDIIHHFAPAFRKLTA